MVDGGENAQNAIDAVFKSSVPVSEDAVKVEGPNLETGISLDDIVSQYYHKIGYQATQLGQAIKVIQEMRRDKCKIFLGYTSNLISSGLREIFVYLAKHKLVDVIVTTAGGVEEDFIKCLAPTYVLNSIGMQSTDGKSLRAQGLNRIGNLVVPNDNYCKFEDWLMPVLDDMVRQQNTAGLSWTPSKIINTLGQRIDNEESVYYWCAKNDIPVYCPALTDGSLGDMIFFHTYKSDDPSQQLRIDIVDDLRRLNSFAMKADKTGIIILGGGLVKHHVCNANLMRNGADYAVYINTGQEFDGSDAGASPDEAVSWGKIRGNAKSVKICADATLVFPLIASVAFRTDIK
ncbi:hypothetical protein MP228_003049 [Amoeboaphelidium protococcarum]|nr:hypothetical protein MP228_003049 [Amoeboaphelidium protococcarum]